MIGIIILCILIIGLLAFFIETKESRSDFLGEILISRTSIAFVIAIAYLGFGLIYSLYISDPLSTSPIYLFFDMVLGIPIAIALFFGYGGGGFYAYLTFTIEALILALCVRPFISKKLIIRLKGRMKT